MKFVASTIVVLVIWFGVVLAKQAESAELQLKQSTGPTLEETLAFIKKNLELVGVALYSFKMDPGYTFYNDYSLTVDYDKCTMSANIRQISGGTTNYVKDEEKTSNYNKKIDLQKLSTVKLDSSYSPILRDPLGNMVYKLIFTDVNAQPMASITVSEDAPKIIDKFTKAFDHARKLCGAKDELF